MILILIFLTFILSLNFVLFYLDDFKLSTNKYIKLLQILSLLLVLWLILFFYDFISNLDSVLLATDPNKNPTKLDVREIITSLYNRYVEFLDSLTPDKIVCLFNIIMDGLMLSSFTSVLSIMLSENVINRISFFDKYPRILKLLKLRNNINKKISKFYLLLHFFIIISGILGNIFMFFI